MADEPRRSGRATKGQHTKNDTPEPPQKKGKGRKKAQKEEPEPEPEEVEDIIRCVCGYVVEDPRDKRAMICCDNCMAWQHNVHMGLSDDDDDLPEKYYCEQCKPEDHKELLDAMARGDKIWETREAEAKAAKLASRRKGKGGRKSAVVEKDRVTPSTDPVSTATPQAEVVKQEVGTKRKLPTEGSADSPAADSVANKSRKTSTTKTPARQQSTANANDSIRRDSQPASTTFQAETVQNIEDLHERARRGAATGLLKTFTEAATDATKSGTFTLPAGQDLSAFALKLAMAVEYALYLGLWVRGAEAQNNYGTQCRAIMHNVKQNTELRDKIFHNHVSPQMLSKMTSEDMQSQEMQQKNAEWQKQNEKQSVLPGETGTLIRRTHKGEEIIEKATGHELDGASAIRPIRRPSQNDAGDDRAAHRAGSPSEVELPAEIHRPRPPVDIRKLSIDTKRRTSAGQASGRKSSATFDVDKVWSSVESPGTPARPTPNQASRAMPSSTKADPDIDRLLKDENEDEEEYSPADYTPDPDTIWAGGVIMATVADLRATAKYAAGANLSSVYPWHQLMPSPLNIEGRIDIDRAEQYLCGLQYSKSKDLTVVSITPADHQEDRDNFNKLFEYFTSRKRYGVIRKSPVEHARDIYVIPLESGSGNLPAFLELLEENALEQTRKNRMLLVAYVINCTTDQDPGSQAATHAASSTNQNATNQNHQRTPSVPQHMSPMGSTPAQPQYSNIPPNPYAQSPSAPQQHFPPPSQPSPAYPLQYQMPQPNGNNNNNTAGGGGGGGGSLTGMAAAIHILGDMANSRAISELLKRTPNIGVNEFGHIKDVFTADPSTRNNLDALLPLLQAKIKGGA